MNGVDPGPPPLVPFLLLVPLAVALLLVAGPQRGRTSAGSARPVRPGATGPLDIARLVERLATVVSSGVAPRRAWSAVAAASPPGPLRDLAHAVGAGADPRRAASPALARRGEVLALGAALTLCERTGAPTAALLQSLARALRDVADADLARRSAFAGPRTTARILLVLPLAGIGLGMLLGADPLRMLLGTGGGRSLLLLGVALTGTGWWWMRRLLRAARGHTRDAVDPSIVLELLTGPLRAGAPLALSLTAVADALGPGETSDRLSRAGSALAAGAPARIAVRSLEGELAPVRDAALVAEETGADVTALLAAAAQDARSHRARDAEAAAARLSVRLVLPTGIALLPAFVVLGIVPTAASLLGGSLGLVLP